MSQCKCDLRTKLVGDGCRYCNPQEYIDNLIESLEEQPTWVGLTEAQCGVLWKTNMTPFEYYQAIEAKLKEKNT